MTHDSVLMLPFSCSHRPGVYITRPNCKARSDGGEGGQEKAGKGSGGQGREGEERGEEGGGPLD